MAKANKNGGAPQGTAQTAEVSADFDWADELPQTTRGAGFGAEPSATMKAIEALPAPRVNPETNARQFARKWFPVTATVPDTVTDPAEREKIAKENVRKLTNQLSGITRRLMKRDSVSAYTTRAQDNNGQPGVAVFRTDERKPPRAKKSEAATASATAPASA